MTGPAGALRAYRRPGRSRVVVLACLLFGAATVGYLTYRGATGPMRDLQVYRDGALAIRRGQKLYAMVTSTGLLYTYPPLSAIVGLALTVLPFPLAKLAWAAVMVCVPLGVATWFGFRPLVARASRTGRPSAAGEHAPATLLRPASAAVFAVVLGCCVLLFPVRQEFYFGQVDLFLVAICLLDCAGTWPRWWPRGLLIGLATAIKLEPGAFIVYLLITRRRKDAAVAAVSFAAFSVLAYLVAPEDSVTYWTSAIFQTKRLGGSGSAANQSLRGMILRAFKPHLAPTAVWLAVALVVGVAGFAAARFCWQRGNDMAGVAITGLLAAALSPVAWIHHYCWVVVAIGVILGDGTARRRIAAAVIALGLFISMLPTQAQTLINDGRLDMFPGRELEDAFGLASLALIVIMWRICASGERAATTTQPRHLPSSGAGAAEQVPSGTG